MAVITCAHCGADVAVTDVTAAHNGHAQSNGRPREWIIIDQGREVHRCTEKEHVRSKTRK